MENNKQPLIGQGWIRVAVFLVALVCLYLLAGLILALVPFIPAGNSNDNNGQDPVYYLLVFFFTSIVSVFTVIACRKIVDRKKISGLGIHLKGHLRDAMVGLFLAIAILGIGTLILSVNNNIQWLDINFDAYSLMISLLLMAMVAIAEELVFRGYILTNLLDSFNKWIALSISAAVFAIFHINNPDMNAVAMVNLFFGGLILGVNYIYTRNLWYSILFHFSWNFFQGPVLGYKVSGIELGSILSQEIQGNILLTGGEFGFEGSILESIICLIAFIALLIVYENRPSAVGDEL